MPTRRRKRAPSFESAIQPESGWVYRSSPAPEGPAPGAQVPARGMIERLVAVAAMPIALVVLAVIVPAARFDRRGGL